MWDYRLAICSVGRCMVHDTVNIRTDYQIIFFTLECEGLSFYGKMMGQWCTGGLVPPFQFILAYSKLVITDKIVHNVRFFSISFKISVDLYYLIFSHGSEFWAPSSCTLLSCLHLLSSCFILVPHSCSTC